MLSFAQSGTEPPEILAEGDQFYCPLSEINVVTEFSIKNPSEAIVDAFYIQISSGYVRGSDILKLGIDQDNVRDSWNAITGKLSLISKNGNPLELEEIIGAVNDVVFVSSDDAFSGERFFSFITSETQSLALILELGQPQRYQEVKQIYEHILAANPRAKSDARLILTGRGATPGLIERADTVTEMRMIKHGYEIGIAAQDGVEQ